MLEKCVKIVGGLPPFGSAALEPKGFLLKVAHLRPIYRPCLHVGELCLSSLKFAGLKLRVDGTGPMHTE